MDINEPAPPIAVDEIREELIGSPGSVFRRNHHTYRHLKRGDEAEIILINSIIFYPIAVYSPEKSTELWQYYFVSDDADELPSAIHDHPSYTLLSPIGILSNMSGVVNSSTIQPTV